MNHSSIIGQFKNKKILVVGDIMLDEYIYGKSDRISPEAPVPIINRSERVIAPGGSSNVANNLNSLGVKTYLVGSIGNDQNGKELSAILKNEGFDLRNILKDNQKPTTVKTRLISNGQQIARIDNEDSESISKTLENQVLNRVSKIIRMQKPDAVIISDYNKGLITPKVSKETIKLAAKFKIFVAVDPKGIEFAKYKGADILTPNRSEAENVTGVKADNDKALKSALKKLLILSGAKSALITTGKDGLSYLTPEGKFRTVPARKVDVFDVTGAGDTFISVFTLSYITSRSWEYSSMLANLASSVVICSVGTSCTTREELLGTLSLNNEKNKIVKLAELKKALKLSKKKNNKIIFTNGCFDLLHPGHIKILKESKKLGDVLVVGLNSDSSVKRLKGSKRPVVKCNERAHLLALIEDVDFVVVFNELTPLKLIKAIRPDIITKGGDYKAKEIVGSDFIKSIGGEVKTIPLLKDLSTSKLIKNITA